jgi:aminotransferase
MKQLSFLTETVTASPIRQMFNRAIGMEDVVSFTVGEPDFTTPEHIVEAAVEALRAGEHKYTPNAGILPLRQAICRTTERSHGLSYDPERQAIVTAGGMEALFLTMQVITCPGDEWLLGDPCWTNYSRQVLMCGGVPKFVPVKAEDNFHFDPAALEAAITPKTKGFIINSPSNPTGGVAGEERLRALAEIAMRHDLYVISDEVYCNLLYDGIRAPSIAAKEGMAERTVIINSFSKSYAMTGWRVGYALGPESVIGNMVKFQENVAACVNSAAQHAAIAALEGSQDAVRNMVDSYARRRKLVVDGFAAVPGLTCHAPQGAFYALVDISATGMNATDFAMDLLERERVIVVPGNAFGEGSSRYVRLSFATSDENIKKGIARIGAYMKRKLG